MNITPALLLSAVGCTPERAELYAAALDDGCREYEINTVDRLAHFLAQVGHESGSLADVKERWGPTPAQLRYERDFSAPWPSSPTEAKQAAFAVNRLAYSLGNTEKGDGRLFCGHGALQTSGRGNHRALRDRLRAKGIDAPDFEAAPHLLELPKWAILSACDYWDMRHINRLADANDFVAVTRAVNGGTNGIDDRRRRWERALAVLRGVDSAPVPEQKPAFKEKVMAIPAVLAALLPTLIEQLPKLGKLFGSGSEVSERNLAAATTVMEIVQQATATPNAQAAVEAIAANPAVREQAAKAIEDNWYTLTEGGGGGIEGARKADAAAVASGEPVWKSPSFIVALALLPLVYMIVGAVVGLFGAPFSEDVRAAIANGIVGLILGGLIGYYYGQSTSRNRTPAP